MKPGIYVEALRLLEAREALEDSHLVPALASDILAVERELGAELPQQYEDFLRHAGCGVEHGGLAIWYHLDLTRPGNLIDVNRQLREDSLAALRRAGHSTRRFPRGFMAIYDSCDGELFGYLQRGHYFLPEIIAWDVEELTTRKIASDLYEFLAQNIKVDVDELDLELTPPLVEALAE
jgi:hypothetical protein